MKKNDANIYFADYLDYSIEKSGRNILLPFEKLTFDLLCFYPASTVLTLTSTLIGSSSTRFVEFHDFWKSGALKIHLSKGDTADKYLSRKLATAGAVTNDNYEINLYLSDGAADFINKYLKAELLNKGIDYVLPRTSNADTNNRQAVLDNLAKNERAFIEDINFPMTLSEFDRLALRLEDLAYDKSFTFQRSHIIRDFVERKIFKKVSLIPPIMLSTLDASYNQAMSKSIDATMISTMDTQLNGVGLRNFIKGYSPVLYGLIASMSPKQIFLLAHDKNWQIFRSYISGLYTSLSSSHIINQNTKFYKKAINSEKKSKLIEFCLDKMLNIVFDTIKYSYPWGYSDILQTKIYISNYINYRKKFSSEDEYYCEEIVKRTKFIEQICQDISNTLYI